LEKNIKSKGDNLFHQACLTIRNSVYGIKCSTRQGNQVRSSTGSAFMIAPRIIVSVAHVLHVNNNSSNPLHTMFEVIRADDIGQQMESARLIAEDSIRDIALLEITNPRSNQCVVLAQTLLPQGTECGSLGFPLATVDARGFHLILRFQGAHISSLAHIRHNSGRTLDFYETDALMYKGSSGCPAFTVNGEVFGLHCRVLIDRPESERNSMERQSDRYAIAQWVPSIDIISFASTNGVTLQNR
jgi:S1-C subfamily serine protease